MRETEGGKDLDKASRGAGSRAVDRSVLLASLDGILEPSRFSDYCPNGLQVEGRSRVGRLVSGVSISLALIEAAIEAEADAILVHHGLFWKGEDPRLIGMKRARIALLLRHQLSLLAYHLPLDEHPLYGNNVGFAAAMGIKVCGPLSSGGDAVIGLRGELAEPLSGEAFAVGLAQKLGRQPLHISADRDISTLAWCTGAGQGFIERAVELGVDAYVTGEVSEQTVHVARETNTHFFAAGHHATERFGVQALGGHLEKSLGIQHRFIDIDNPV